MNIRISFSVPPPFNAKGWKRHKWCACQKANGGMLSPSEGGYLLRSSSNLMGAIAWEWDYKAEGEFIEYGGVFFPCA